MVSDCTIEAFDQENKTPERGTLSIMSDYESFGVMLGENISKSIERVRKCNQYFSRPRSFWNNSYAQGKFFTKKKSETLEIETRKSDLIGS